MVGGELNIPKGSEPHAERLLRALVPRVIVYGLLTPPKELDDRIAHDTGYVWNGAGRPVVSGPLVDSSNLVSVRLLTLPKDPIGLMYEGKWPAFIAFYASFAHVLESEQYAIARGILARFVRKGYTGRLTF